MARNSIGGALSLQIQHKTRLTIFADFSSDDVLSAVLLSDSEDDSLPIPDDDNDTTTSTAMDIDDHEAESQFEIVTDIANTLPMPYHNDLFSRVDLLPATLEKLRNLEAPTPENLSLNSWEKHLRKLLVGTSEPAYCVCRLHGSSSRYFLKATRKIQKWEALGVLVGRLIETKRWEKECALKRKKARNTSTGDGTVEEPGNSCDKEINEVQSSSFRWEITAESLKKISQGAYSGPDLMIDLQDAANELVHLHDPFWEEESACAEEANTELYTSLITDPASGVALPTTVLYSTREIEAGETLTVNWDDAYWSEISERENLTAAATAWGSLHFPLLQLRDLAFRNGIPVSTVAPYYEEEIKAYKLQKKIIEMHDKLGTVVTVAEATEESPFQCAMGLKSHEELAQEEEEQQEQQEVEFEVILELTEEEEAVDSDDESIGGGLLEEAMVVGEEEEGLDSEEEENLNENSEELEALPSIRIELDTSSKMGTFTDGKCSDEEMDVQGKKKRRKKKKNGTKMFMDSKGSWWLDDGNSPRLLIKGAYARQQDSTQVNCTIDPKNRGNTTGTATDRESLSLHDISLYRHLNYDNQGKKQNFKPFRSISKGELARLRYTTHCDFSHVPQADLKRIAKHAENAQYRLPLSVLQSIDTGICPKVEVTEIMDLHHPVRYLTRPDRPAYGVNIKPGCKVQPNEPLGIYVGEVWREEEYLEARGQDVDKQMYTYTMTPINIAECVGLSQEWISKKAESTFPTLMVDAYGSGNVMRFINDVYARKGNPKPNVGAEACVDPRTGLPFMLMRWIGEQKSAENDELMVDYGATQYWKVGGRALHRELKRHAEVAFTAIVRLKAALGERGVSEDLIEAAAESVDISKLKCYEKHMG